MDHEKFLKDLYSLKENRLNDIENYDEFKEHLFTKEGLKEFFTESLIRKGLEKFPGILSPEKMSDEKRKNYLGKIKEAASYALNAKKYKQTNAVLKLGLSLDNSDIKILFLLSLVCSFLNDSQGSDKYFQMFLESIPEELPKEFLEGMTLPNGVVESAVNILQEKINNLKTEGNYQYALYCCQTARILAPDNLDLRQKEHKLKDLKKTISTPKWLIDGVEIVVDAVEVFSKKLTQPCRLQLQDGNYFPYNELLTKDIIFLDQAPRTLKDQDQDQVETTIVYENDQFTVTLKRGLNHGELEIKKK